MFERWVEIAGLLAALCWAIGSLIFSRIPAGAGALNFAKNLCGFVLLALVILLQPVGISLLASVQAEPFLWLAASAIVGILIGDGSHLRALQILGPRRALILSTMTPVFAAAVGWFFLAEALDGEQLLGIALTLIGVVVVIRERSPAPVTPHAESGGRPFDGMVHGVNAALCQAVGAALTKKGMEALPPLEASLVRLGVALVAGLAFAMISGRGRRWVQQLTAPGVPGRIFFASSIGTFLGIWLSLIAIEALPLAIANTQTATTPIFITILVALILRERISSRAWTGTVVAMGGVIVLIFA